MRAFLSLLALAALLASTREAHAASFPYITLNSHTNRVSDNGSALTYNGTAVGGGSVPTGTMVNSGSSTNGTIPRYTSATGTNLSPSSLTVTNGQLGFYSTATNGQPGWRIGYGTSHQNADLTFDESIVLGYNWAPEGFPYNTNWYSLALKPEACFPYAGTNYAELNLDYIDVSRLISRRFLAFGLDLTNHTADWGIAGRTLEIAATTAGNSNSTKFLLSSTADASTFPFNGSVSATKSIEAQQWMASRTNFIQRNTSTIPFATTNYERFYERWNESGGAFFEMGTEANGSGSIRSVRINVGATNGIIFDSLGTTMQSDYATLTLGSNHGAGYDVTVQSADGNITLKPQGTSKKVIATTGMQLGGALSGVTTISASSFIGLGNGSSLFWSGGSGLASSTDGLIRAQNSGATADSDMQMKDIYGGTIKQITNSARSDVFFVTIPATNTLGGRILWEVKATDGTDTQGQEGETLFTGVKKVTTVTASTVTSTNLAACTAGTLTVLVDANTATNNVMAIGITPTSSLTTTNIVVKWRLMSPQTTRVTAL